MADDLDCRVVEEGCFIVAVAVKGLGVVCVIVKLMDPVLQEISLNRCRHCDWVVSLWWISSDEAHSQDLDSWDRMALQEKGYRAVRLQIKR